MSEARRKTKLKALRERLDELSPTPKPYNLRVMAERVESARVLCDDAYKLFQRINGRFEEEIVWKQAAALFHRTLDEAYPDQFWESFESLQRGESLHLDAAITFLEIDPWFFRSGYIKADLLRIICRLTLSATDAQRLRSVVLAAIDFRDRREFRWFCKLARRVTTKEFKTEVENRIQVEDKGIQRRARWVLSAITHNKSFHIRRASKEFRLGNYKDAIGHLNRAIFLEPGSVRAFLLRGKTYAMLKNYELALHDFSRVLEISLSDHVERCSCKYDRRHLYWSPIRKEVEGYKWRAWTQAQLKEHELAVEDFSKVLDLSSDRHYALRERARAYYRLRKYEQAMEDLTQCLKIDPADADTYFLRGLSYLGQGNLDL
ncbi:MAG TPA: tetratricopeptide repeat protein, partial [Candidatus Obscuribacterales bacterium]|nr:tetratricopeptide repeat protein [Candidatus Obscuribacterales bacterium]